MKIRLKSRRISPFRLHTNVLTSDNGFNHYKTRTKATLEYTDTGKRLKNEVTIGYLRNGKKILLRCSECHFTDLVLFKIQWGLKCVVYGTTLSRCYDILKQDWKIRVKKDNIK